MVLLGFAGAAAAASLRIEQAEFSGVAGGPPLTVALPDTWSLRGQAPMALGRYRARFELAAAPAEMWALRIDRLITRHEVRLNGRLVHGSLAPAQVLRRPVPTLIDLPPELLHAGTNELEITIDAGARAGLSALLLGPAPELANGFVWSHHRAVTLPQMLNLASAGAALFTLLLWWARRSEATLGSFGALVLLTSLRNHAYFVADSPFPGALTDWLYFFAQAASVVLFGWFAMDFAGRRIVAYRRALLATAVVYAVAGALAAQAGELHRARAWLYPWLLLLALPALALILQAARQRRSATEYTLVVGMAVVLGASAHDYLYQQGRTSVMDTYWVPYAVPVVMAIFAALLLKRLALALEGVERLNATLERRVAERTRELQAANRAKTRFLAAASHDLRQPMVGIGLLVGLLREQVAEGPLARVVQRLQEAAGAMEGLLKRLLDLSRLESGTVRVHRQPLALQPLFDAILADHAGQAARKGLRLTVRPSAAHVHSDPALLEQILRNLVGNAVRYTDNGGVLVGARPAGPGHWRIEVWDSGPGIPADQHEAIFAEFVQLDGPRSTHDGAAGLGLGLSIVQRCAGLLDAPLGLRSRLGRGSCFSVRLPRAAAAPPRVAAAPAVDAARLAGLDIWLLEDNAGARASMQLRLEAWGARVLAFATVAACAGRAATAAQPDLVVTDQRLPDGWGGELLARLRQRWPALCALIVTGDTAPQDLRQLERWRAAGVPVLQKPFEGAALLEALLQALDGVTTT